MIFLPLFLFIGFSRCEEFTFDGNFEDFFMYTVQNQINRNVSPCDNFYAHACPNTTKQTVVNYGESIVDYMAQKGIKLGKSLNKSYIEILYETLLPKMEAEHYSTAELQKAQKYITAFGNIRKNIYMLRYMHQHNIHTPQEYKFFENIMDQLLLITEKELNITHKAANHSSYTESLISTLRDTTASIGFPKERFSISDYEELLGLLDKVFFQHFQLHKMKIITPDDVMERRNEFKNILKGIIMPVMESINAFANTMAVQIGHFEWNGMNVDRDLIVTEHFLLAARNTSKAAKYGYIGQLLGHELMHSMYIDANLERNPLIGEKTLCSIRHVHRIRKEFDHDNNAGLDRYVEDTADHEGGKIAYKVFLEEFGDRINDPIAPGVDITNNQMFFYALSTGDCNPLEKDQSTDKHSMGLVRVNGAVSLINGFHEAFGCKPGDRMKDVAEDENCNLVGNPVK